MYVFFSKYIHNEYSRHYFLSHVVSTIFTNVQNSEQKLFNHTPPKTHRTTPNLGHHSNLKALFETMHFNAHEL